MDKIATKSEITTLKRNLAEMRKNYEFLASKNESLKQTHEDVLRSIDNLERSLKRERKKGAENEVLAAKQHSLQAQNEDLSVMLDDLKKEKELLDKELKRMIEIRFQSGREEKFRREIKELQTKLPVCENVAKEWALEREELCKSISNLQAQIETLKLDKTTRDRKILELEIEIENEKNKSTALLSREDLDEAVMLLKMKRDNELKFDHSDVQLFNVGL